MGAFTKRIMTSQGELRIRGKKTGTCEVHDWPDDGMGVRLVQAMKDRHPKGINVCNDCLHRAHQDVKVQRGAS